MSISRGARIGLGFFGLGLLSGVVVSGALPFARYDYARVGTDLQRVDRRTGRVEWSGDAGWWNQQDRYAPVEAEARRFGTRAEEIAAAAARGDLSAVRLMGRELTVYPRGHEPFKAYANATDDPRLAALLARLRDAGVEVSGA